MAVIGAFLLLLGWVLGTNRSSTVEIASIRPVCTAQITGTTGDEAQVWIWTRGATLLTNLSIPTELRLDRRELLLQVRSTGNQALDLDVAGTEGTAHVHINVGEIDNAEFVSFYRYPFVPLGGFTTFKLHGPEPFVPEPFYETFWSTRPSRFNWITNLPGLK